MQSRAYPKYLLFALLPLFIIAAALWWSAPKNAKPAADKMLITLSKAIASSSQSDVPFVSNDAPQISRAEHRSPTQNWVILLSLLFVFSAFKVDGRYIAIFSADKYACLFKTLFPAHEFS